MAALLGQVVAEEPRIRGLLEITERPLITTFFQDTSAASFERAASTLDGVAEITEWATSVCTSFEVARCHYDMASRWCVHLQEVEHQFIDLCLRAQSNPDMFLLDLATQEGIDMPHLWTKIVSHHVFYKEHEAAGNLAFARTRASYQGLLSALRRHSLPPRPRVTRRR
jgi:hypothetical protein